MTSNLTKEERKRQLLDAAIDLFGRRGYHRTQISNIIAKARVARGTFYLYFEGKREIFDVLITELFERVRREIRSLPRDAVDQIPGQLKGNIERATRLLLERPLLAKILFSESVGLDPQLDRRLKQFYDQILELIQRGLRQGQEMGFVRKANVGILSIALLGCVKEIFYQSLLTAHKPSINEIVDELCHTIVRAVARPEMLPAIETVLN